MSSIFKFSIKNLMISSLLGKWRLQRERGTTLRLSTCKTPVKRTAWGSLTAWRPQSAPMWEVQTFNAALPKRTRSNRISPWEKSVCLTNLPIVRFLRVPSWVRRLSTKSEVTCREAHRGKRLISWWEYIKYMVINLRSSKHLASTQST